MQRDHLPKLELDGFQASGWNTGAAPARSAEAQPSGWRAKASQLADKAGLRIEWGRAKKKGEDVDIGYKRLLVKTGICAAIAIAILVISTVTTPGIGNYAQTNSDAVSQEFDIPEDIGKLKFVQNLDDDVESVMSVLPDTAAVYPSDGEVVTAFGQAGSCGTRFSAADDTVYSIARGTVTAVGSIDGQGYVKVQLDTGEAALYVGIDPIVQVDDIVQPGQTVGILTEDYLYLELRQGEAYIDPVGYITERMAEDSSAS